MYHSPLSRFRRGFVALAVAALTAMVPVVTSGGAAPAVAAEPSGGYWMVASDGGIFSYGGARFHGSTGAIKLNMPIVGMAATPSGGGYWLVASDGGIFAFGDAGFFGSTGNMKLNKPIVGMAATPSGQGYWLVATDGGIFAFGDAGFYGSMGAVKLNKPITGMTPSASGKGYRMVASDGGLFSFGDAAFLGSTGDLKLAKPISGMAPTPSGKGYWIVGSDGALFPFGDAPKLGAPTSLKSVAAVASSPTGAGYWAVGADGALAAFGDAADLGHPSGALTRPIVGMAVLPGSASVTGAPGGGTDPTAPGAPGTGPGSDPTVPTTPVVTDLNKLYASHALEGTIGTRPQVQPDPSHPFRHMCEPWGSDNTPDCHTTDANAEYSEEVRAFTRVGNRLFMGGFIHGLLDPTTGANGKGGTKIFDDINYLVELDATTGKVASDLTFTRNAAPNSTVEAMMPSPDGKILYIGGRFTQAGGKSAPQVAALDLQTGLMVDGFDAAASRNGSVHSIALAGDRLYIGGGFSEVDGKQQYASVAALDARTGKLIEGWVPPPFSGAFIDRQGTPTAGEAAAVNAIAVLGQYLVVGGEWVHVGADAPAAGYDPHSGITALNLSDGARATWRPLNDRPAFAMAVSPDGTKVCAAVGGAGGALTCFQAGDEWPVFHTGNVPDSPTQNLHDRIDRRIGHVDGDVLAVAVTDQRVYLGGHFDVGESDPDAKCLHVPPSQCFPGAPNASKTATPNRHLIAFDWDGKIDPDFTAQADTAEGVSTLLAGPGALYVGGNMKQTLDEHPGAKCWPCTKSGWSAPKAFFHPGFAMLPAKP